MSAGVFVKFFARSASRNRAFLEETIGAALERTVAAYPDREALVEV